MRIRWRGLELPSRVVRDEATSTDYYGRFTIEPFEHGFGTTIGNSLRRILLSSLEGASVTTVKLAKVSHEFTTIPGVVEDVTDIVLNVKGIVLRMDGEGSRTMMVSRETAGEVKAGDIVTDPSITIINPDHHLATLTTNTSFKIDMTVRGGRGYATANDNRSPDQELGVIPIDSTFSPVIRVRFRTEDMRVGQRTNYDRLIMEVWTNGTIRPEDALVEAGLILRKHLNPFVMYYDFGHDVVTSARPSIEATNFANAGPQEILNNPVSVLNLSVRASNCLEAAGIKSLRELVSRSEADLLRFRSFGKTSLHEVQRKLSDMGLRLGMNSSWNEGESAGSEGAAASMRFGDAAGSHDDAEAAAHKNQMEVFTMGD